LLGSDTAFRSRNNSFPDLPPGRGESSDDEEEEEEQSGADSDAGVCSDRVLFIFRNDGNFIFAILALSLRNFFHWIRKSSTI
jgi:hypothetical protein